MRKIKTGIVGLGRLGRIHAQNLALRLPQADLTAVCSLSIDELQNAKKELGVNNCYTDFHKMIKEASIEALVIASNSDQHCDQVVEALEAGLHVFCEKPLGVNMEECKKCESAVNLYPQKVFMLGFMRRFDPSYQYADKKIKEGYIGKPVLFRSYSVDPVHAIKGSLAYLPYSAGQFLDMAIHDIDLARWLLNCEPKTVFAMGGCYAYKEFADFEDGDNVSALMQFENDTMVFLFAGRTAPHGYNIETEIIGTEATLRIGSVPQKNLVELLDSTGIRRECSQSFPERFSQAFEDEMKEFLNCIIEERKPEITVYDGIRANYIAELATKSFRENKLIRF